MEKKKFKKTIFSIDENENEKKNNFKEIIFCRHGQSIFNAAIEETGKDPYVFDADITEKGKKQALEARKKII